MGERNLVTPMWVPDCKRIKDNEEDILAKERANTPFLDPEPFLGLLKSHMKATLLKQRARTKIIKKVDYSVAKES